MHIDDNTTFEDVVTSQWFLSSSLIQQEAVYIKPPHLYYSLNNKQIIITAYNIPVSASLADVTVNVRKTGVVTGKHCPMYGRLEKDHIINNLSLDDLEDWITVDHVLS